MFSCGALSAGVRPVGSMSCGSAITVGFVIYWMIPWSWQLAVGMLWWLWLIANVLGGHRTEVCCHTWQELVQRACDTGQSYVCSEVHGFCANASLS